MRLMMIPIVVLGTDPKGLQKRLLEREISRRMENIQTTVLLKTPPEDLPWLYYRIRLRER